jgi:hypothetical protein
LYLYLGSDLTDQNQNIDRLTFSMVRVVDQVVVPMWVIFDGINFKVLFEDSSMFVPGAYKVGIDGILIPAGNVNDLMTLTYVRDYDLAVTMRNTYDSTVTFPRIIEGFTSNVQISGVVMEGAPSLTTMQVQFVNGYLNPNTIIYVHYPLYYSPGLYHTTV